MSPPVDPGLQTVFDELKEAGVVLPDPTDVGVEAGGVLKRELRGC